MKYAKRRRIRQACSSLLALSIFSTQGWGFATFADDAPPLVTNNGKYSVDLSKFTNREVAELMFTSVVSPQVSITEGETYSLRVPNESQLFTQKTSLVTAEEVLCLTDAEIRGKYWIDAIGYPDMSYADLRADITAWVNYCNTNIGDLKKTDTTITVNTMDNASLSDIYCLLKKTAWKVEQKMYNSSLKDTGFNMDTKTLKDLKAALLSLKSDSVWEAMQKLLTSSTDYGVTTEELEDLHKQLTQNDNALIESNVEFIDSALAALKKSEFTRDKQNLGKLYNSEAEFIKAWNSTVYSVQRTEQYSTFVNTGTEVTGTYSNFYDSKFDKLFTVIFGENKTELIATIPEYTNTGTADSLATEWNAVYAAFKSKVAKEMDYVKENYIFAVNACSNLGDFESVLTAGSSANDVIGYLSANFAKIQATRKGTYSTVSPDVSQQEVSPWLYLNTVTAASDFYTDGNRGRENALEWFNPVYGTRAVTEAEYEYYKSLGYSVENGITYNEDSVDVRILMENPKWGTSVIKEVKIAPTELSQVNWYSWVHDYIISELMKGDFENMDALTISQSLSETVYTNALLQQLGFTGDCRFVVEVAHNYVADVTLSEDDPDAISKALGETTLIAPIPEYSISEYYDSITELPTVADYNAAHSSQLNLGNLGTLLGNITNSTNTPVNSLLAINVQPTWLSRLRSITEQKVYAAGWVVSSPDYTTYKTSSSAMNETLAHYGVYDSQGAMGSSNWTITQNPANYGLAADLDSYYAVVAEAWGTLNAGTPYYRTVERLAAPMMQFTNDNVPVSKDITGNVVTTGGLQAYFNDTTVPVLSWDFSSPKGVTNLKTGNNTYDIDYHMWLSKTSTDDGIYVADWIPDNKLPYSFDAYIASTQTQNGAGGINKSTTVDPDSNTGEVRSKADSITIGNAEVTADFSDYALSKWIEATPYVWCEEYKTFVSQADLADHNQVWYYVEHTGIYYTTETRTKTEVYYTTETDASWQSDIEVFDLNPPTWVTEPVAQADLRLAPASGMSPAQYMELAAKQGKAIPDNTSETITYETNTVIDGEALETTGDANWISAFTGNSTNGGNFTKRLDRLMSDKKTTAEDKKNAIIIEYGDKKEHTADGTAQWIEDNMDMSKYTVGQIIPVLVVDPKTGKTWYQKVTVTEEMKQGKGNKDPIPDEPDNDVPDDIPPPPINGKAVVEDGYWDSSCNCNPAPKESHSHSPRWVHTGWHYDPATVQIPHTYTVTYVVSIPHPYTYETLEVKDTHTSGGSHTDTLYLFKYAGATKYGEFSYDSEINYTYKYGHVGSASNPIPSGAVPSKALAVYDNGTETPTAFSSDPDSMKAQSKIADEVAALKPNPDAPVLIEGEGELNAGGDLVSFKVYSQYTPKEDQYNSEAEAMKGRTIVGENEYGTELSQLFGASGTPDTWLTISNLDRVRGVVRQSGGDFYTVPIIKSNTLTGIQSGDEALQKLGDYKASITTPKQTYTVQELISRITSESNAIKGITTDFKVPEYGNPNITGDDALKNSIGENHWQSDYVVGYNKYNLVPEVLMTYKDGITDKDGKLKPDADRGALGHVYVAGYNEYTLEFPVYSTIDIDYNGDITSSPAAVATGKNAQKLAQDKGQGKYPVVYTGSDVATTFSDKENAADRKNSVVFTSWVLDFAYNNLDNAKNDGAMAVKAASAWNAGYTTENAKKVANDWLKNFKEDKNDGSTMFKANLTCTTTFTTTSDVPTSYGDKAKVSGVGLGTNVDNVPISSTTEIMFGQPGNTEYTAVDSEYRIKIRNGRLVSVYVDEPSAKNFEYVLFSEATKPDGYATSEELLAAATSAGANGTGVGQLYTRHYDVFEAIYNMRICEFAATLQHNKGSEQWNKYKTAAPTSIWTDNKGKTVGEEIQTADPKYARNANNYWYGEDSTILSIKKFTLSTSLPSTMNVASKVPASYGYKSPSNKQDLFTKGALYAWAEFGISFPNAPASTVTNPNDASHMANTGTFDLTGNELTHSSKNLRDPEIQYLISDGNVNDMY